MSQDVKIEENQLKRKSLLPQRSRKVREVFAKQADNV